MEEMKILEHERPQENYFPQNDINGDEEIPAISVEHFINTQSETRDHSFFGNPFSSVWFHLFYFSICCSERHFF